MSALSQDFAILFGRELDHLADEVAAYRSDADLWSKIGAQKNPPGTLALHVAGGLMAMIGTALGGTGYVRDRDREFSERDMPREEVVRRVRECRDTVVPILAGLDDSTLAAPHPGRVPPPMQGVTTHAFLLHLLWHLGWHLGHIYYHRLGIAEPAAPQA